MRISQRIVTILITIGAIVVLVSVFNKKPTATTVALNDTAPNINELVIPPLTTSSPGTNWKTYPAEYYGFTFKYPSSWVLDSSLLERYSTVTKATKGYSNALSIFGSNAVKSGTTNTPLITIEVAPKQWVEKEIGNTFSTAAEWLQKSSTAIPPLAKVETVQIHNKDAIKVSGLTIVRGSYELVYLYDATHSATVKFDATYSTPAELATLEIIISTFQFTNNFQ